MKNILVILVAAGILAACSTAQIGLATVDTCATNAAVISSLADVKSKLTSAQIAAVNKDITVIDSVCMAASPDAALSGAESAAAQELAKILAGAKK